MGNRTMTIGRKEKKKIRNPEEKKNGENTYYFYYTTSFLYLYETTKEKLTVLANSSLDTVCRNS